MAFILDVLLVCVKTRHNKGLAALHIQTWLLLMYIYIYICIYTYIHTFIHVQACMHVCIEMISGTGKLKTLNHKHMKGDDYK